MKYVNTHFFPQQVVKEAYEKLYGHDIGHQMTITVKAKGRKDAERICEENGLNVVFKAGYSNETGNKDTIVLCDKSKSGIVINRLCGIKETEYTWEQIKAEIKS